MEISINQIITFIITLTIFLFAVYWSSDYYKYDKFRVFLTFLSAIAVIFGILAIVIQGLNYGDTVRQRDTDTFLNLNRDFIQETFKIFIENPDMTYYYNELIGLKKITKQTKRNITKEHNISMLIFAKLASIVYYIETNRYNVHTHGLFTRTNKTMNTFLKSTIFREYWKDYKEKFAGNHIRNYVKKHYNLE